ARVRSAVGAHWRREVQAARRRRASLVAAFAAAAAAALVVAVGRGWWRSVAGIPGAVPPLATLQRVEGSVFLAGGRRLRLGDRLTPGSDLETGDDGRAALSLVDGPSLRLDSGTRLRLMPGPVVELDRGALYVDSGTDRGPRPARRTRLEVRTKMGSVRDVGTQFEVSLRRDTLRLSVREGLATLVRAGRSFAAPAGTRLLVEAEGAVQTSTVPAQGPDWDWVIAIAPAFDLEGRTLREYLDWVTRETGWRVEFVDPAIAGRAAAIVLHGSVVGLRPDQTPAAVLPTCGFRHRLTDGSLIIERQGGAGGSS
ncbi:MAG TPA: FecR family protein, partial [Candidatus Polarisedimenticolia bacterium]|nr:FecR family protein [Candidatus Polarisedimenticolia bacterium]